MTVVIYILLPPNAGSLHEESTTKSITEGTATSCKLNNTQENRNPVCVCESLHMQFSYVLDPFTRSAWDREQYDLNRSLCIYMYATIIQCTMTLFTCTCTLYIHLWCSGYAKSVSQLFVQDK